MCCSKYWLSLGAIFGATGVILGAFAAHGLEGYLMELWGSATKSVAGLEVPASWKYLQDFRTAANYQMYHALALVGVGILSQQHAKRSLQVAGISFGLGVILFCGSLYIIALTGFTKAGMIAPIGGLLFIVGWSALAVFGLSFFRGGGCKPSSVELNSVPLPMSDNRKETDPVRV